MMLDRIQAQARANNVRVTQHAQQEMVEEDISLEETHDMKCSIDGCPREYEAEKVMHTVRHHGQVTVIDHVPANVCSVCGDVLLEPDTVRRIEALLEKESQPASTVPLYEFA